MPESPPRPPGHTDGYEALTAALVKDGEWEVPGTYSDLVDALVNDGDWAYSQQRDVQVRDGFSTSTYSKSLYIRTREI